MKSCSIIFLFLAAFGQATTQADIRLGAPGLEAPLTATDVSFKVNHTLSQIFKFVFRGIEAKSDTLGAPGSSGSNGNGGQYHISATVSMSNSTKVKTGHIYFRDEQDFNSAPWQVLLIPDEIIFQATSQPINVYLQWDGQGNAKKPNGIFNILGEYRKHPPIPVGSLNFGTGNWILAESGAVPEGVATVIRE